MDLNLSTWGPVTIAAVLAIAIILVGGAVEVITTPYTFHGYLEDLKWVAGALGIGAGIGRGLRLGTVPLPPATSRRRTTRSNG